MIRRVLIVKLSSLGDIVHATPVLRAARRAWPAAEIAFAVEERFADLLRHSPLIDTLITCRAPVRGSLSLARRTWRDLTPARSPRTDFALDLQGTRRSACAIYASRARVKAGRGGVRPGWQGRVSPDTGRHAVRVCAEVAAGAGLAVEDLSPEISLSRDDDRALTAILAAAGLPPEGFVLANPFSRWRSKEWPADRWAAVLERVGGATGIPIALTGGPGEEERAAALLARLPPRAVVSLAGRLSLGEALCLFRRARLMLSGDSGPMHAAAALGVSVVALFGPTFPERTGPWGAGHRVLQARRPPYHHTYRTDPTGEHIRALGVEPVVQAALAALAAP